MTVSFRFLEPLTPVLAAVAVGLVVLAIRLYRSRGGEEAGSSAPLVALRMASIALVVLLLMEPVLAFLGERSLPPRIAVLVDASLSMTLPFPAEEEGDAETHPTRAEQLAATLARTGLLKDLGSRGDVETYRFGGTVELLSGEGEPDLEPREDRTDLARALAEGVAPMRRRTGAVVLLSDGSHNVGAEPRAEARRLGVPIYAVGVGSEGSVTDVSVFEVAASGVAYLDNRVPVLARLRARGDPIEGAVVYLSEGEAVLDSARVDLPGGGVDADVELHYEPTREGLHRYRVWTPVVEGEISAENNQHLVAVRVLKEKIRVLLVASSPSFDFTFLRRALAADVSLEVESVLLSLERLPGRLGENASFPETYADLAAHDLILLLDAGVSSLPREKLDQVARFVTERGGALVVMGSPGAFELGGSDLAQVLPVEIGGVVRARSGQILPRLTASGRTHAVTALDRDPDVNERLWNELPPLAIAPLFPRVKPEARVLVRGEIDGVARGELPVVSVLETGRGRVLALCGSPFWRWDLYLWGTGRTGDHFRRFVSRSVRWLVARDELKQVMVRPAKSLFDGAETVVIEGQVFDDDFRPVSGSDVRATVRGPLGEDGERAREVSLVDTGQGRYRAALPGLPPGDYTVEGSAALAGEPLGEDGSEMTVAPYRLEFEDPSPNFELLREMARETGGEFLLLEDVERLPGKLALDPVVDRTAREKPLQESSLVFLALLGLLGSEWALRRGRGLP